MALYTSFAVDAKARVVVDLDNGTEQFPATLRFGQVSMALTEQQLSDLRWQAETAWAELGEPDGDDVDASSSHRTKFPGALTADEADWHAREVPDGWGMADPEKNSDR